MVNFRFMRQGSSQQAVAIWRDDEYILNFLLANRIQFQPMNNADRQNKQ
jgi:hypothetical protein